MHLETNKARYAPAEQVAIEISGAHPHVKAFALQAYFLASPLGERALFSAQEAVLWKPPSNDFKGYLLELTALDESKNAIESAQIAVDISSNWRRFPRYGYVWDFREGTPAKSKIHDMCRFHLNGVQYYDWQYRHHLPLPPGQSEWQDWSGRQISGGVLREYLSAAHKRGMLNLAYNMIYAANGTYLSDKSGVDPSWRLVKESGGDFSIVMGESQRETGVLQYFNPMNKDWQAYLFARQNEVFQAFAFDGWHGDTIGENGAMTTPEGLPLGVDESGKPIHLVKDCYTPFLNAAKAAIGDHELVFNPVGAQGIENVYQSAVDVLYAEFWPWDGNAEGLPYDNYFAIHREILRAEEQSKSLVVAGYVNYRNPSPFFNPPAVLLMEAVCFASGGARIELGNGCHMLSDEYFPKDESKAMGHALKAAVVRMYDFAVAYENLLRDGQKPLELAVDIAGTPCSRTGESGKVWVFAKGDAAHTIVHFINLIGTDNEWRDTAQAKAEPLVQAQLSVKAYVSRDIKAVYMASPDGADLKAMPMAFAMGTDGKGRFIAFTMPTLAYWNMVFMR